MKAIEELQSDRHCSPRTMHEVQEYTAHYTIRAAQRAVADGTDDALDRDLVVTLAEYQHELAWKGQRVFANGTRGSRRKREDPMRQALAESAAESEARLDREYAEQMQRHPERAAELQATTDEFLNRFIQSTAQLTQDQPSTQVEPT